MLSFRPLGSLRVERYRRERREDRLESVLFWIIALSGLAFMVGAALRS